MGSTKTGGIFNPEVLHAALLDGKGFGEALRLWFNDTWTWRNSYGFDDLFFDGWWLGMMVQGDPLVTIQPPTAAMKPPKPQAAEAPLPCRHWSPEQLRRLGTILGRQAATSRVHGYRDSMLRKR